MQWLINLITEKVLKEFSGQISLWSGAIVDIPDGWVLCDGSNGTPDLRNRFIPGAGSGYAVGATGGTTNQTHNFTSTAHDHVLIGAKEVQSGVGWSEATNSVQVIGTTDAADNRPLFYALAYVMRV